MTIGNGTVRLGYDSFVGVAEETTFGTKVQATAFTEFNSESMKRNIEEQKIESINTSRDFIRRLQMNETVEGSIECDLNVGTDAQVYIIKQALGGTSTNATLTSAVYGHTILAGDMENNEGTIGGADTKALTFQIRKGGAGGGTGTVMDFLGCRVNTLSIKGEVGTPCVMSAELIGKTGSVTSSNPTVTITDATPIIFSDAKVYFADSISGSFTEQIVQSFEFTVNNNLVSDTGARGLGSRVISQLPPTRREVMLKLNQRFDTTSAYDHFIAPSAMAIEIRMITTEYITASTTSGSTYAMYIRLPKCYFNSNVPEIGDFGVVSQELEFSCISENTTTGYAVQAYIQNGTEGY